MQSLPIAAQAIRYIEENLDGKLELDTVAAALHYSKFYLHRSFRKTVGLTVHGYIQRRQLTEAARRLAFSQKPILEIALMSGYESQQAFTGRFKALYKTTPGEFRAGERFYPLQLALPLREAPSGGTLTKDAIRFAAPADAADWMELARLAVDGYPYLDWKEYAEKLRQSIAEKRALLLRDGGLLVGALGFSGNPGRIDYLAVHPQYRRLGIPKLFLDKLTGELLRDRAITVTTYRAGDQADTGYRAEWLRLGFAEGEMLVEYGYPTQRLVLPPHNRGGAGHG